MEILQFIVDVFLHLDRHLGEFIAAYGTWTYGLLFTIVFLETGVVVTPFLPGDSLLFAAGTFAGMELLNVYLLFVLLSAAAILGDTVNYWIGKSFGDYILKHRWRLIKKEHLDRTHAFFEKYGGMTIILARFVPIVRTFAPFVAGLGVMNYRRFLSYNVIGGVVWVGGFLAAGYGFGNLPWVKKHFSLVVLAIIIISVMPMVWGYFNTRMQARAAAVEKKP